MSQVIEKLRALDSKLPERFSRESANSGGLIAGLIGRLAEQANPVNQVKVLLSSQEMSDLIDNDQITIAMIKPRLDLHMDTTTVNFDYDSGLADFLTDQISADLEPVLSVSFQMTPSMVKEFYKGNPMNRMMEERTGTGRTRWVDFNDLMASGPVTFLLLHSPDGNAIDTWRRAMGTKWNVDVVKKTEPNSLRARFAKKNDNNLLHGSDSPESVRTELNFIIRNMK